MQELVGGKVGAFLDVNGLNGCVYNIPRVIYLCLLWSHSFLEVIFMIL